MARDKLLAEWFWTDRWDGSSAAILPLEARGLYREMLTQAWRRGGYLPNDHATIQRAVRCSAEEWARTWPLVEPYWEMRGNQIVNITQLEVMEESFRRVDMHFTGGKARAESAQRDGRGQFQRAGPARRSPLDQQEVQQHVQPPSPDLSLSPDPSPITVSGDSKPLSAGADRAEVLPPVVMLWNRTVAGSPLPVVRTWSAARSRTADTRLREEPDLDLWGKAFALLAASPHHRGQNERGWVADIDFIFQAKQAPKWLDLARSGAVPGSTHKTNGKPGGGMTTAEILEYGRQRDRNGSV